MGDKLSLIVPGLLALLFIAWTILRRIFGRPRIRRRRERRVVYEEDHEEEPVRERVVVRTPAQRAGGVVDLSKKRR